MKAKERKQKSNHSNADSFKSEQFTTPKEFYEDYAQIRVDAEKGDMAFIHMDLINSSGSNITNNQVRYTAQIRFNTINDFNYRPIFMNAEYPESKRTNR